MAKISKTLVDSAAPGTERIYLWDSRLSGFGLVIQPSGRKSYCFQYRDTQGKTRRMSIGRHGDPHTPESARAIAKKLALKVAAGDDPLQSKRAELKTHTAGSIFDLYLDSARFAEKAASTRAIDRGRIERHLKPLLGKKIAARLSADEIRRAQAAIAEGKTAARVRTKARGLARVTGGEGAARMAVRLLRSIFAWALAEKLVAANPAADVNVGADGRRDTVIRTGDEYQTLFKTIQNLQDSLRLRAPVADAIRVIALTGARRGEMAGMRWRHVDLKNGVVVLPPGEHKTGKKTSESRVIGLPSVAQAIIARQPAGEPNDYVFLPARGVGALTLSKPWRLVRKEAGLDVSLGLHGLRHSLASQMAMDGAQAVAIMTTLGHKSITTAQRYVHIAKDARAEIAEQAAAGISAALLAAVPAPVIPMRKKRR